jgi:hypothetical protein
MKCIQYPSVYFLLLFISFSLFLFTFSSISFLSFPFPLPFSLLNPYPSTSSRAKRKPRLERILLPPKDPAASRRQAMPRARLHRELPPPLGLLLTRHAACSCCCLTSCCGPPRRELPLPGLLLTCRAASKHRRPASCSVPLLGLLLTHREEASVRATLKGKAVKRDGGARGVTRR